ncbi:MAG: hypothetical protein IJK67_00020 [Bacilli bacterium]|nr:hypothetical protein [Bacilli bacterium]
MEQEMITICKKPGVKNCVRISGETSIPDFLKEVVRIDGDTIVLDCLEGEERCPLGSVIAFEKLESGKMNVWNKANWKETTKEVDGVFYELPRPNLAVRITDKVPQSIVDGLGDRFTVLPTGEFQIDAGWGLVKCAPNNGYVVIYGKKEDGSLDANFLTKGTPSFGQYYVLDENGEIVQSLQEYDDRLQQMQSSGKKM